jgi:hypothetical protein
MDFFDWDVNIFAPCFIIEKKPPSNHSQLMG